MEHFVTLFDKNFLPSGICLYRSLNKYHGNFVLWVICMDDEVWVQLSILNYANIKLIKLSEVENSELIRVKKERTNAEYCWTLTPFAPKFILDSNPTVDRVTYVDADLYFFDSTSKIFDEFESSESDVLITEHGYSKRYDKSKQSGIYCVQFMTFKNTANGRGVLAWWQKKCIEWCFNRIEDGKFGDQKYLDDWPVRFGTSIHVLKSCYLTLAPWNVDRFIGHFQAFDRPTFYHFHGLRIISNTSLRLYFGYRVPKEAMIYYSEYTAGLIDAIKEIWLRFEVIPILPEGCEVVFLIKKTIFRFLGLVRYEFYNIKDGRSN